MKFSAINLKRLLLTLVCGLVLFVGVGSTVYGQNWHERHEWRERQERRERRAYRRALRNQGYVYTYNPYAYSTRTYVYRTNPYRHRERVYVIRAGRRVYYWR